MAVNSYTTAATAGFPQLTTPFVDSQSFTIEAPWYRLLVAMWTALGGQNLNAPSAVYFQYAGSEVTAYTSQGASLGLVALLTGGAEEVLPTTGGALTFTASGAGMLLVDSGTLTFQRGPAGTPRSCSPGAIWMLAGDVVRVAGGPADVFFYPAFGGA